MGKALGKDFSKKKFLRRVPRRCTGQSIFFKKNSEILCRVPKQGHSAKKLFKKNKKKLCRVPGQGHSAKYFLKKNKKKLSGSKTASRDVPTKQQVSRISIYSFLLFYYFCFKFVIKKCCAMETILSTCDVPTIKRKTRVLGKKCPFSNKLLTD